MKSLVFGASGFIGTNLVKKLEGLGHEVDKAKLRYNLPNLIEKKYDYIFYLSSYGNMYNQKNDWETFVANTTLLFHILNGTLEIPYKGFINFSSSSVMLPYETMYSATKAAGERIVKAFVNKYDKRIVNVRPFTVIGKGDNPDHLIPKLINSCITGDQMLFVGAPVHDYVSVDDLCDAVILIMENAEKFKGQTLDIGTGKQTTNEEIFNIVRRLTDKMPRVNRVNTMRNFDTDSWVANAVELYNLGWKPKQTIEDVIRSMI